jgi:septal ring factor EnvC (AmiA/AmiB activator)
MTDVPPAAKSTLSNVLGINKNKARPTPMPNLMNEEQLHEESIRYAIAATNQLRDDLSTTRAKLVEVTDEYAHFKSDAANELMTERHEFNSKLAQARADNEALRRQLTETGEKLERFMRRSYELKTQCDNYERFFGNALNTLYDAGQHVALSMTSAVNNATASLNDAARHVAEGLTKQIKHQVDDARAFLAEIKEQAVDGEYNPAKEAYKPSPMTSRTPEEVEEALAKLGKTFGADNRVESDEH